MVLDASDLRAFADGLDAVAAELDNRALLTELALAQERHVRQRLRRGEAPDGSRLPGYSARYAQAKRDADYPADGRFMLQFGVRREGTGEDARLVANAYDTMLQHLTHEVGGDSDTADLFFDRADKARLAEIHHTGEGHMPERPFMAVSDAEATALARIAGRRIDELLSAAL